ncbi:MAG TPA: PD-(D/E)XK nuclease family protein [Candidatus Didemnitutus sp.]|nr:PD-(D/E)XK nuclease family protein [Candidatus Didemnitutus sp.]
MTAFKHYLRCPFRFYLAHVLQMQPVDPEKSELDAFDFGHLCHGALEAMAREPGLRDCADATALRDFLLGWLDRASRARYGKNVSLPLVVQFESARQRLSRAAEIQAQERAAGWVIERVEWKFPEDNSVQLGGLVVRGKIDRIDRHEKTGAVRVLDYKTSDRPVNPQKAHCQAARDVAPALLAEAQFELEGVALEWTDLQLPLYRHALADEFGADIACGYFNLPKAIGETGIAMWAGYTPEWQSAAVRCGEAVARAIAAGRFWPPNEDLNARQDDFAGLFHRGVAESIAPGWAKEVAR